jgi:hypothetical protein
MVWTLSSRATPLLKFVLTPLWAGAVAWLLWLLWQNPERVLGEGESGAVTLALQWFFLALLAGSLLILFAFVVPLKRVRLGADGLHVSNYLRDITIPFGDIARIRQNWLPTFRLVTLDLRTPSPFGRHLVFMPDVPRRMAFWRADYRSEDAVVRELRSLAGLPDPRGM